MVTKFGHFYKDGNLGVKVTSADSGKLAPGLTGSSAASAKLYETASSGERDGQVYGGEKAGAMLTAKAGVTSRSEAYGATLGGKGEVTATTGAQEHATGFAGSQGAGGSVGGTIGSKVTVQGTTSIGGAGSKVAATGGFSAGDQLGGGVTGELKTEGPHKLVIKAGGHIAAIIGLHAGFAITLDDKPIEHLATSQAKDVVGDADIVGKVATRQVSDVEHDIDKYDPF